MNVGVKNIIIASSFDRIYMLDIVKIKLCTSKQHSLFDDSIKLKFTKKDGHQNETLESALHSN